MELEIPVAPGELLDRISILEIKSQRIQDAAKRDNVRHELDLLKAVWSAAAPEDDGGIKALYAELKSVNEALWAIEDAIREHEARGDFGPEFIRLARSVYHRNDRRASIKRAINHALGSRIVEEKSYADYGGIDKA